MNDTVKFLDTCWKNLPREEMRGFEGKSWIYQVAEQSSKGLNTIKNIVDFWDTLILEDFEIHTIIDETDRILTQQGNYQHDSSQIDLHSFLSTSLFRLQHNTLIFREYLVSLHSDGRNLS
jgi:hypothetical protein